MGLLFLFFSKGTVGELCNYFRMEHAGTVDFFLIEVIVAECCGGFRFTR